MTVRKAVEYIFPSVSNFSTLHLQLLLISLLIASRTSGNLARIPVWSSPTETAHNSIIQLNGFMISIPLLYIV